jgi:hypothetical protein
MLVMKSIVRNIKELIESSEPDVIVVECEAMEKTDSTADKKGEVRPTSDKNIQLEDKIADEKEDELINEPAVEKRSGDL